MAIAAMTPPWLSVTYQSPTRWTVGGELDIATAFTLVDFAHRVPAARVALSIDIHDLTFIDVAGWRALTEVHTAIGHTTPLYLLRTARQVSRVLDALGAP